MTKSRLRNAKPGTAPVLRAGAVHRKRGLPEYLAWGILALGCFVLLTPVMIDYAYYAPATFFKGILFRILVQIMLFLYAGLAVISPEYKPRFNRIGYALTAWFGVMLLSSLPGISTNAWRSWWGDFARMDGMFSQLHLLAFFFVLVQTFRKEREWLWLFSASLISSLFMGLIGLIESTGSGLIVPYRQESTRIEGATGNPDFFGSFMLINLWIGIYMLARTGKRDIYPNLAKAWLVLLIAFDVAAIVWTIAAGNSILSSGLSLFLPAVFVALVHCAVLLWYLLGERVSAGVVLLGLLCVHNLFWVYRSQTRAALVGIAGAFIVATLLYIFKGTSAKLRLASGLLLLAFLASAFVVYANRDSAWVRDDPLLSRMTSTSVSERRFTAWNAGLSGILDRPWLGWGPENYGKVFDRYAPAQLFQGGAAAENWDDRAHNIILDVAATTGFIGFAAYLAFYFIIFSFLLKRWMSTPGRTELLALIGLLSAYWIQNLFIFDTVNTNGLLFLVLAYVSHLFGFKKTAQSEPVSVPLHNPIALSWKQAAPLIAIVAVLICAYHFLVAEPRRANLALIQGMRMTKVGDPPRYVYNEQLLNSFLTAESYRTTGVHEAREEFANYASELMKANDIPLEVKSRIARKAIDLLQKSIVEDPIHTRHYMYAASMTNAAMPVLWKLDRSAAQSMAERNLDILRKAAVLGPNRPRLYAERAQTLLFLDRPGDAVDALKKAADLDPKEKSIQIDLVAAYILSESYSMAETEWNRMRTAGLMPQPADYQRLIDLYASKKQVAPIVALYNEQLKAAPDDPMLLARAAAAYRELGDMHSARKAALRAAELSPVVAEQIDAFLKSLDDSR